MLDLIIIGGGPTGICVAIEAEKAKLNYLVLEKGVLVNSLFHFPTNMTFFSTSLNLEIGGVPFISHVEKPTRKEALEYYRRVVESWKLKIHLYEKVLEMKPLQGGGYEIFTSKNSYRTRCVVVATGYYDKPRLMNVPGEDLPKVKHYYDEAHPYVGQKVLVVGAANSACDVALETFYKGAQVTMAIREGEIYDKVKYWIRPNIENRIKEGSIEAFFNTMVKEIRQNEVVLQTLEGERVLENDFVLAMTGYQVDFVFLQHLGIVIGNDELRTPQFDPVRFETNLPGVYLAGVAQGGLETSKLFIENTRHHGEVIVNQLIKVDKAL
ncbi:MAG: YpdA family putative bacillithiol disulfide reductase [Bacteroidota bacterium]